MSLRRRAARLEAAASRTPPPPPPLSPPPAVTPVDIVEEEWCGPTIRISVEPEVRREPNPDLRMCLAFDVGLRSLSWAVVDAWMEPRGKPSKHVQIEEWVRGEGESGPWRLLAWDWADVLVEMGYERKGKAQNAPETIQSKAMTRALLKRTREMRLLEVTDIVVECQDNRNPKMRAVARSILTFFDTWFGVMGIVPPAIYAYTGARKMQGIAALDGCAACPSRAKRKKAASAPPLAPPPGPDTPPPTKRKRSCKGKRSVLKSRSKADYDARKDRSVRATDEVIRMGLITDSAMISNYEAQKKHFKKSKGTHAGDDMGDALWHAISQLWRVCKTSTKQVPVPWGEQFYSDAS